MLQKLARAIVRGYPGAWRERYEVEVLDLITEERVSGRDVFDLARGLVVERARSVIEPGEHPALAATVYWLLLMSLRYLPGIGAAAATVAVGLWLNRTIGPAPTWVVVAGGALFIVGSMWRSKWYWPADKAGIPSNDRLPMPRARGVAVLSMVYVGLGVVFWADPPEGPLQTGLWLYLLPRYIASQIRPRFTRSREILWAFDALSTVKSQLKWAQMELDRCRLLQLEGQWVPLVDAEAEVRRLREERDEILGVLHRCGYRSRFGR